MSNINKKEREIEGTVKGERNKFLKGAFCQLGFLTMVLLAIINFVLGDGFL